MKFMNKNFHFTFVYCLFIWYHVAAVVVLESANDNLESNQNTVVEVFGDEQFDDLINSEGGRTYMFDTNRLCTNITNFQKFPPYIACKHELEGDSITRALTSSPDVTLFEKQRGVVHDAIQELSKNLNAKVMLMDFGAHIGLLSLPIAKMGVKTWAVEPLNLNLVRIYEARKLNNLTSDSLKIFKNAIDLGSYREVFMDQPKGDASSSMLMYYQGEHEANDNQGQKVNTVKLTDFLEKAILTETVNKSQPLNVFLNIDINAFECHALIQLSEFITSLQAKNENWLIGIPYVMTRWANYRRGYLHTLSTLHHPYCNLSDMEMTVQLMTEVLGYEAYRLAGSEGDEPVRLIVRMDKNEVLEGAHNTFILWQHKDATPILEKSPETWYF